VERQLRNALSQVREAERLAATPSAVRAGISKIADDLADAWRRAMVLMSSATAAELTDPELPPEELLFRLFHEDGVRVYRTHELAARCRCSRRRIEEVLKSFAPETLGEMREEGAATVTCEFCNARYVFDVADLDRLIEA
jgi:molecular chaperone Hsp33